MRLEKIEMRKRKDLDMLRGKIFENNLILNTTYKG